MGKYREEVSGAGDRTQWLGSQSKPHTQRTLRLSTVPASFLRLLYTRGERAVSDSPTFFSLFYIPHTPLVSARVGCAYSVLPIVLGGGSLEAQQAHVCRLACICQHSASKRGCLASPSHQLFPCRSFRLRSPSIPACDGLPGALLTSCTGHSQTCLPCLCSVVGIFLPPHRMN